YITASIFSDGKIRIKIKDKGCGIEDIKQAREPLYTTKGGERSGLGFAVMESFMDKIMVRSNIGKGTTVTLTKQICGRCKDD
ncbi:MAG: ATP-binding protein, partial [Oscillospiraceae bacterium]